jgi:hypothetical protein
MVAFYLKGVAPKHVTLNQIFLGMLPFMAIQILAIVLLYQFPPLECVATAALQIRQTKKKRRWRLFVFVNQRISARRPGRNSYGGSSRSLAASVNRDHTVFQHRNRSRPP